MSLIILASYDSNGEAHQLVAELTIQPDCDPG